MSHSKHAGSSAQLQKVRLDKWLWAARFFRTRSLAKQAIEGGKVHFAGSRVKTSKEISVGDELTIRQGAATAMTEKTIIVKDLSTQRGNATIAQTLYEETQESIERRAYFAEQRKLANLARPDTKPNKKQRRELQRFKYQSD
ncbi:RNA-binding S4 domain-containing protein [Psychrobacter sp. FDAARGOS_221]|uniref:RNA-binding S4 domain-containing protein n=1 Tax=Psychrobacter sp. FDAARGOS_221 TaxID=1975705 RepID=UPI000BB55154|nr:S4 domain-containing protein [Psychrobacter sp. FDAARGOS_221]PNK61547.1 RNA-binding protein [Psychrobacter sp. FDAARGOS_221]